MTAASLSETKWVCRMNTWDLTRNRCEVDEDEDEEEEEEGRQARVEDSDEDSEESASEEEGEEDGVSVSTTTSSRRREGEGEKKRRRGSVSSVRSKGKQSQHHPGGLPPPPELKKHITPPGGSKKEGSSSSSSDGVHVVPSAREFIERTSREPLVPSLPTAGHKKGYKQKVEGGEDSISSRSGGLSQKGGMGKEEDDDVQWVQCDKCQKWRIVPDEIDANSLPDKW